MKALPIFIFAAAAPLHAGETESAAGDPWLVPTFDARLRYEFAEVDGFDPAHGLTLRLRPGLRTGEWGGFSAFLEGEFTGALLDDFHGGAVGVDPFDPANSTIADPESVELNQAYLQYRGFDTTVRLGRQRIVHDNAAFIGNVGWRQNEQTYDAVSATYELPDRLTVSYAWVDRVHRVFGPDAAGIAADVPADLHFLHATFTGIEDLRLGGYVYLMDFREAAADGWDNETLGLSAKKTLGGIDWHAEVAFQNEAGPLNDAEALYFHGHGTRAFGDHSVTLGVEHLGAGFQTPLATLHSMNGFADATDLRRALGTHGGLTDTYLGHTASLPWDLEWTNVLHLFGDNELGTGMGVGFDSVLTRKFGDRLSATAKLGYFDSNDPRYLTTTRASVQLDFSF